MQVMNLALLLRYVRRHAGARVAVEAWLERVERADRKTPSDMRRDFSSADFLSGSRVLFNIGGNNHRMLALVGYRAGRLEILWIGTHAEYDKQTF